MIMDKLNTDLRDHAVSYGLCQQWQNDWQDNKNQQELIDMYIRGIDFCIEHDYPTVDYIKNNFTGACFMKTIYLLTNGWSEKITVYMS